MLGDEANEERDIAQTFSVNIRRENETAIVAAGSYINCDGGEKVLEVCKEQLAAGAVSPSICIAAKWSIASGSPF